MADNMKDRIKTGISGLDEMLMGGLPKQHHIVLCGGPGSGKTLLSTEFLYRGAELGENGLYVSIEEGKDKLEYNVRSVFQWPKFDEFVKNRRIIFEKLFPGTSTNSFDKFANKIQELALQNNAKRIVIDSSTILRSLFESPRDYRLYLFALLEFLSRMDATVIITVELSDPRREELTYDLEQFLADGVIVLYNIPQEEERIRAIEILKMRGTDHAKKLAPYKITDKGFNIFPNEKIFLRQKAQD